MRNRAAAEERKRAEKQREEDAIKEARSLLTGLFIIPWSDPPTYDPKRELDAAVNFIDSLINDPVADHLPSIVIARTVVLPILKRAQPPKQLHGRAAVLNSSRDRLIAEVASTISKRYEFAEIGNRASWEKGRASGCTVVWKALRQLGAKLSKSRIAAICTKSRKSKSRKQSLLSDRLT
jgi:hypothetical protein